MCVCQVLDVDVVTDTRAIISRVVSSENLRVFAASKAVQNHRNQVQARGVRQVIPSGSGDVEVAQANPIQSPRTFSISHHPLTDELGFTVGINRLLLDIFGDHRDRRHSVDGCGGGEDHVLHSGLFHRQEHVGQTTDVLAVIPRRTLDRFSDLLLCSKVNDTGNVFVDHCLGQLRERFIASNIDLDQGCVANAIRGPSGQVVDDNNLLASFQQKTDNMRADVTGASGNKNAHVVQCTAIKSVASVAPWKREHLRA